MFLPLVQIPNWHVRYKRLT